MLHQYRDANDWNNLSQEVIDSTSVNMFKNRLDKNWKDMGIYSWEATSLSPRPTTNGNLCAVNNNW